MKLIIVTALFAAMLGCNSAARPVAESSNAPARSANSADKPETATAHTLEDQTPPPAGGSTKTKWSQSGDPIDTREMDAAISSAEKNLADKPADGAARQALAAAYYKRATALTGARQYASALGDYRKALKNDPTNANAKEWIDRIISIYDSINRESPAEGEEPPPLPFKKDDSKKDNKL